GPEAGLKAVVVREIGIGTAHTQLPHAHGRLLARAAPGSVVGGVRVLGPGLADVDQATAAKTVEVLGEHGMAGVEAAPGDGRIAAVAPLSTDREGCDPSRSTPVGRIGEVADDQVRPDGLR